MRAVRSLPPIGIVRPQEKAVTSGRHRPAWTMPIALPALASRRVARAKVLPEDASRRVYPTRTDAPVDSTGNPAIRHPSVPPDTLMAEFTPWECSMRTPMWDRMPDLQIR